jgi:hypothetical protein
LPGGYAFHRDRAGVYEPDGTRPIGDLRRADVVVLADRWLNAREPNDSMKPAIPRHEVLR